MAFEDTENIGELFLTFRQVIDQFRREIYICSYGDPSLEGDIDWDKLEQCNIIMKDLDILSIRVNRTHTAYLNRGAAPSPAFINTVWNQIKSIKDAIDSVCG